MSSPAPILKTLIRPAVPSDLPRIVEMGMRFLESSPYKKWLKADRYHMEQLAKMLMDNDLGLVIMGDTGETTVGMMGVLIFVQPLSGQYWAQEMTWWVEPEHRTLGLRMLRYAEEWARSKGADVLQMISPDEKVDRLYLRLGYEYAESSFIKRL